MWTMVATDNRQQMKIHTCMHLPCLGQATQRQEMKYITVEGLSKFECNLLPNCKCLRYIFRTLKDTILQSNQIY